MAFADNLYAFGNRGGLLSRIEQNRGVQVANDLNQYRLGAAQREEQKLNTLGELYSKARAGDTAAVDAMARLDPKFAMGVETHQAGLQKEQQAQQTQQQEQVARQAIWANSPEKWQSTPFAQQGIPFEQRDAVIGQFIGNEGTFKAVQDMNKQPEAIQTLETLKSRPDLLAIKTGLTRAGAPNTQVQIKQDTKEGEAVGKFYGEEFANLQLGARKARQNNAKLDRLEQMFATATPGRLAPLANNMKAWAQGAGIDLESIGVTDTTSEADSIAAITNQMALALRNPAGGEGMPGALSDKDREFLMASVPGLQKTPGGNQKIIEYMRRMNQRSIEEAAMAREYRKLNGSLDETFYDLLDEYAAENPVFPEAQDIVNQNAAPQGGSLSDMTDEQLMQMLNQ